MPDAYVSVSTWSQPKPESSSPERTALIREVAMRIDSLGESRLRVCVDGLTASGKTSFGHELAAALRELGRTTLRASLDDFKKPWADARLHGYDRTSGEGYYRNAFDFESTRKFLLEPMGRTESGVVALCSVDPLTQVNHQAQTVLAPADAVLVVDGVFAMRPEYDAYWDFRIWLDVDFELSVERGIARDCDREGTDAAEDLHRNRYGAAERIYMAEVDPKQISDLVIDNSDFRMPQLLSRGPKS